MTERLTRDDVLKVARLARLKLSEAEVEAFTEQLGQVLEYISLLGQLDTDEIEPLAHAADLVDVFREDEPRESLSREQALANAPSSDGAYFMVPPILPGT